MPKEPTTQVAFRLADRLITRIDRHVKRMERKQRGIEFNRADAARDLLIRALDDEEHEGGTVSKTPKGPRMMPTQDTTVTIPWHRPRCSHCRKPIEDMNHAHGAWRLDKDDRTYGPVVVHTGDHCTYYDDPPADIADLPLDTFRRAPMEAVKIAMQCRGDSREERMQWAAWLSIVLGLPYSTGGEAIMLATEEAVAEGMLDRVPTLEELRRPRRGGS